MGFSNYLVTKTGFLVRTFVRSLNYVAGVSGWTINKDGSAEFNNLTVRGTFAGAGFIINSTGAFFYNGTPAANNLTSSITPFNFNGTDPTGLNWVIPGSTQYQPDAVDGAGYIAQQATGYGSNVYFALSMAPFHSASPWGAIASTTYSNTNGLVIDSGAAAQLTAGGTGNSQVTTAEGSVGVSGSNGTPYADAGSNYTIDRSQTSTGGITTTNPTSPTAITAAYTVDGSNGMTVGATHTIETWFNGTWGGQKMTVYADINGTSTALATIGAVFAAGAASGDSVNGWLQMKILVVSGTACRIHLKGSINDQTLNSGAITTGTGCPISSTVATGITIALLDTLAIAIEFAGSVPTQQIVTEGSEYTRRG